MGSMAHQTNSSTVRIRHGYGLIHHPRKKKKKHGQSLVVHKKSWSSFWLFIWLVVLTILKHISQWEGLSYILWKINNV